MFSGDNFDNEDHFQHAIPNNEKIPTYEVVLAEIERNLRVFHQLKRGFTSIYDMVSRTDPTPRSKMVINVSLKLLLYKTEEKIAVVSTMKKNLVKHKNMRNLVWFALLDFAEVHESERHMSIELIDQLHCELERCGIHL